MLILQLGDPKESYYIGSLEDTTSVRLNQWPSDGMDFLCAHSKLGIMKISFVYMVCFYMSLITWGACIDTPELLPNWKPTMESLFWKIL